MVSSIISDHNAMRPDINYKETNKQTNKQTVKITNTWRLNNMFLNYEQVTEEIKREIKKLLEINDNENTITQNLWDAGKSSYKREVHSNTIIPQETKITSNRQPNFTPKTTGQRGTKKPQS